jgi:hypothetical protein
LVIDENVVVDNLKEILKQTKQFYEKFYKKQNYLNFSGLMWESLSSDLLIMDINKGKCLSHSDRE